MAKKTKITTKKTKKSNEATSRNFSFVCNLYNDVTGEPYLVEDDIMKVFNMKTITEWAYGIHNLDRYTRKDIEEKLKQAKFIADDNRNTSNANIYYEKVREIEEILKKPDDELPFKSSHWHGVIWCQNNSFTCETIAKRLGIPANFVRLRTGGHKGFLHGIEYITHEAPEEQEKGKYLYPDDIVITNVPTWREELNDINHQKEVYGRTLKPKEELRDKVLHGIWTLNEAKKKYPLEYADDINRLEKLRLVFLMGCNPPKHKCNFYIYGKGGVGKGIASDCLAYALFPEYLDKPREELIFDVGSKNVTFYGYDGQPVIIWDDFRADELLRTVNGVGNLFTIFDTYNAKKKKQNAKFGAVNLINIINIVNGQQPWMEFFTDIVSSKKENEDISQACRRFPIIIPLEKDFFTVLYNTGYFEGNQNYKQYRLLGHYIGSFQKLANDMSEKQATVYGSQKFKAVADKTHERMNQLDSRSEDNQNIVDYYENIIKFGTKVSTDELMNYLNTKENNATVEALNYGIDEYINDSFKRWMNPHQRAIDDQKRQKEALKNTMNDVIDNDVNCKSKKEDFDNIIETDEDDMQF